MVAMISVDGYPFLAFSDLTWHLKERGIGISWLHTVLLDRKETELGSSNQEAFPSTGKNIGVVLVSCLRMEVRPYSYFQFCGYF